MQDKIIGIIGGFGAYATLAFMDKLFQKCKGESERNYPHIICDNNFKMPSRTKALLYGDDYERIVRDIADSMRIMLTCNAEIIVLPCGTAHYFLEDVYAIVPEAENRVLNIIDAIGGYLREKEIKRVLVIAAEGTLKKHLYKKYFGKYKIECIEPNENEYEEIRYFIECVKQNDYENIEQIRKRFIDFLTKYEVNDVVLGCTEFPVLVSRLGGNELLGDTMNRNICFYDPLDVVVDRIKESI